MLQRLLGLKPKSENYRDRGLGSLLLQHLEQFAIERNYRLITGGIVAKDIDKWPGLPGWYRRRGYEVFDKPADSRDIGVLAIRKSLAKCPIGSTVSLHRHPTAPIFRQDMPTPDPVEFALQGEINGTPISPAHVPFGVMRKFHDDVEKLVLGSNQGSLNDTVVEIRQGSYALVVPIPETVRESFERDMAVANDAEGATNPDPTRLNILLGWQRRTAFDRGITYFVRPQTPSARFAALKIDADTPLRRLVEDRWIPVELMLLGELREAGGEKANIHVRLRDQPKPVIVAVNWEQLARETLPFAGEKLLRVSAERNERTKMLRKLRLIEFVPYRPTFDEAAFARMTTAGVDAWQDVPDAANWVREQRGGSDA